MSWYGLPAELRSEIVSQFELPRPELGSRLPSQVFRDHRTVLRNLCLTCRSAAVEAQPWLYRTIVLFLDLTEGESSYVGSGSMVPLLRTLIQNPALRLHIKYLACALPIGGGIRRARHEFPGNRDLQMATWKMWLNHHQDFFHMPDFERRILDIAELSAPGLVRERTWRLGLQGSDNLEDGAVTIAEKILAALFCLLPEVDTFLIEGVDKWPCDVTHIILEKLLSNEATASSVLPKLGILQLQLHDVPQDRQNRRWPMVSFDAVYALLNLPTLRHIETWHDDGFQSFFDFQRSRYEHNELRPRINHRQWLPKIETLSLSSANYHCSYFYAACEMAPNLRHLYLNAISMDSGHSDSHFHSEATLNAALLLRAQTLVELHLAGFERHAYKHLSAPDRLTCFPSMIKLLSLTIDVFMLFGPPEQFKHLFLPALLPPNLERLDLCDKWSRFAGFGDWALLHPEPYLEVLVRQLEQLAEAVRPQGADQESRLSRLRSVSLRAGPKSAQHRWLQAWKLLQLEQMFDQVGIVFQHFREE